MEKIKLYIAKAQSNNSGAAKGTAENPYTEEEFETMLDNGTWPGGYVQNMGYVMKEVVVSSSYPDSGVVDSDDSWSWSDPWSQAATHGIPAVNHGMEQTVLETVGTIITEEAKA